MNNQQRSMGKVKTLVALLAAAGMAAVLAGCADANSKDGAAAAAPAAPPVSAAVVIEKPVLETQEFSGRLEAVEEVEIRSRVSGYITAVNSSRAPK